MNGCLVISIKNGGFLMNKIHQFLFLMVMTTGVASVHAEHALCGPLKKAVADGNVKGVEQALGPMRNQLVAPDTCNSNLSRVKDITTEAELREYQTGSPESSN